MTSSAQEIPRPANQLALIDLDGTLINREYAVTDERIYETIANAQQRGWLIGLSSDTPYEALTLWKERFGMNGQIIAEKGAVVEIDGELQYDTEAAAAFTEARKAIEQGLRNQGVSVWSGNPVEALREGVQVGEVDETVVLMNSMRLCSLSYFVRRVYGNGELQIDDELTAMVARRTARFYPSFDDVEEEINPDYGIVIASRSGTSKRSGTKQLMVALGVKQVAMIGNSMGDYLGADIALHYAVGDATDDFKTKADYVARGNVTEGVVEILERL